VKYGTAWHVGRLLAQTLLIGFIAWVAELGLFKVDSEAR